MVETALVLPMLIFALLGIVQLSLTYHARMVSEYAAFKAARAASVYRLDCARMRDAALLALVPTLPSGGSGASDVASRFTAIARRVLMRNSTRVGTPLVLVDYRLANRLPEGRFDTQLEGGADPMKVHVRLAYFYEYRIPYAGQIMARYWLATQIGYRWADADSAMVVTKANQPTPALSTDAELVNIARTAITRGYYTSPLVSSWSMRMMSDPLSNSQNSDRCR